MTGCFFRPSTQIRVASLNFSGSLGWAHPHAGVVEDDHLDPFGAHDGADAAAAGVPGRALFHVGEGNGGGRQLHLSGRADGDEGDFFPVFLFHLVDQVIVGQQLQAVIGRNLNPVLVDEDPVEGVVLRFPLQDDGRIAQAGQDLEGLAAGIGLLDAAGQGAFAAHRDPAGHGRGGPAQQTRALSPACYPRPGDDRGAAPPWRPRRR